MSEDKAIKVGRALPGPGVQSAVSSQSFDYSALLGKTASLESAGENISLDPLLPKQGILQKQIGLADWGNDWLVLQFDSPLEYENGIYAYSLIRARWLGVPIGSKFCPVFVLLDARDNLPRKPEWSSKDFEFVSWGQVSVL